MSDLSHLWQRFLLASALVVGLVVGVAVTVFGYSNLGSVDVHWSVFHVNGVPLWTVAVVPVALVLITGTFYHWVDGLHHFTEHMRHRRRVHELESEVSRLRAHLDQVLEMPREDRAELAAAARAKATLPSADVAAQADEAMSGLEAEPEPTPPDAKPKPVSIEADAGAEKEDQPKTEALKTDPAPAAEEPDRKPSGERKKRSRFHLGGEKTEKTGTADTSNGVKAEPVATASEV